MSEITKLIPIKAVADRACMSRSSIYRLVEDGAFPRPVKVGPRRVAWVETEVDGYIADRVADRDRRAA